jgi:hypothetical protein
MISVVQLLFLQKKGFSFNEKDMYGKRNASLNYLSRRCFEGQGKQGKNPQKRDNLMHLRLSKPILS